ncbi:hypothetical protein ACFL1R_11085 [Candidatus Latescibacterota bacterium]
MKGIHCLFILLLCTGMLIPVSLYGSVKMGDDFVVETGKTVDDAVCFGGNVYVRGVVSEDAVAFGGDVVVETGGRVRGEAVALGGNVIVETGGEIHDDAVSIGGTIQVKPGGVIKGERISKISPFGLVTGFSKPLGDFFGFITRSIVVGPITGIFGVFGVMFALLVFLFKLVIWFAIAILLTYFFPENVSRMADCLQKDFPKAFLLGLMVIVLIPLILLFLLVTLIGIPAIPLVIAILFLTYLFGTVGVALWAGRIIPNSEGRTLMVNVLLGVLAIGAIKLAPIVGFLAWFFVCATAFGVVILSRFGEQPPGRV